MLREGPPQHAARVAGCCAQLRQPRLVRLGSQLHQAIKLRGAVLQPGCQAGVNRTLLAAQLPSQWRLTHREGQHSGLATQVPLDGC